MCGKTINGTQDQSLGRNTKNVDLDFAAGGHFSPHMVVVLC